MGSVEAVERSELPIIVTDAMLGLSAVQRDAICLAFFDGLTHAEIAMATDVPLGTAKTRVRDGMRQLGRTLAAHFPS